MYEKHKLTKGNKINNSVPHFDFIFGTGRGGEG